MRKVRQFARFRTLSDEGVDNLLQSGAKVISVTPASGSYKADRIDDILYGVMFVPDYFEEIQVDPPEPDEAKEDPIEEAANAEGLADPYGDE